MKRYQVRIPVDKHHVAPYAGAWIETGILRAPCLRPGVAPYAGAWIETSTLASQSCNVASSLPTRERGLKPLLHVPFPPLPRSLPTRERGLKQGYALQVIKRLTVAPYAGAWIETCAYADCRKLREVAPYAGAWIETCGGWERQHRNTCRSLRGSVD